MARPGAAPGGGGGAPAAGAEGEEDALETFTRDVGAAMERLGAEIERLFAGAGSGGSGSGNAGGPREGSEPPAAAAPRGETLLQRRDRLDGELRHGLERLGIVVRGPDVARAVGAAVGKRIEWTG